MGEPSGPVQPKPKRRKTTTTIVEALYAFDSVQNSDAMRTDRVQCVRLCSACIVSHWTLAIVIHWHRRPEYMPHQRCVYIQNSCAITFS